MGFSKNVLSWIALALVIVFVGIRLMDMIATGDGDAAFIGLGIAAIIVIVVFIVLKGSGSSLLKAVTELKPASLVKQVNATNTAVAVNKDYANSIGQKAKGGMTAQVASFDREAATLWTGGKNPKVCVSVPTSQIQALVVRKLNEGMRTYQGLAVLVDGERGALFALKESGDQLQPAVMEIANALGVPQSAVTFIV